MSVKRQYSKKNGKCKVTLTLPKFESNSIKTVAVLGDFNNWNPEANCMNHTKNGAFKTILQLEKDHSYQFRYLIDGKQWENDPEADEAVPNFHGSSNSVIHI